MKQEKTMLSLISILPLLECWEMTRLAKKAQQGWVLKEFKSFMQYKLVRQEPQVLSYLTAYQEQPNDAFLTAFTQNGWTKIARYKDTYIFSADKGEKTVCVDVSYRIRKYQLLRLDVLKTTFMAIIPIVFAYFWLNRVTSDLWTMIATFFMVLTFVPFLISLAQLIGYVLKIAQLQKGIICKDKTC